ncbi:hypothetical protein D3C75_626300 [compost metagenome]
MIAFFQLGAGFEQRVYPFGRYQTGYSYQLRDIIVMRHRLESFLVKTVRNDSDAVRVINIRSQVVGKRPRHRHQPVADMLQFTVNRDEKLMLQPAFKDGSIQNQLAFIAGVQSLNQRDLGIDFFHR